MSVSPELFKIKKINDTRSPVRLIHKQNLFYMHDSTASTSAYTVTFLPKQEPENTNAIFTFFSVTQLVYCKM